MAVTNLLKSGAKVDFTTTDALLNRLQLAVGAYPLPVTTSADFIFFEDRVSKYTGSDTDVIVPMSYSRDTDSWTISGALFNPDMTDVYAYMPSESDASPTLTLSTLESVPVTASALLKPYSIFYTRGLPYYGTVINQFQVNSGSLIIANGYSGNTSSFLRMCENGGYSPNGDAFIIYPFKLNGTLISNYSQLSNSITGSGDVFTTCKFKDGEDYQTSKLHKMCFIKNTSVQNVTLLDNITDIEALSFNGCTNLQTVSIHATSITTKVTSYSNSWFNGAPSTTVIHIPSSVSDPVTAYGAYWNYYSSSGILTYVADL